MKAPDTKVNIGALDKLCLQIADLKQKKAAADKISTDCGAELEKLYEQAIDMILETGQKKWYVQGAGTFIPNFKRSYTIQNQERLKAFLTKHGLTSIIRLHPQVIKSWADETLEAVAAANKKYAADIDALNAYALKTYGFTVYERKSISFRDKEGAYKGAEETDHGKGNEKE